LKKRLRKSSRKQGKPQEAGVSSRTERRFGTEIKEGKGRK